MEKIKKTIKYILISICIAIYAYYFILNNFNYDILELVVSTSNNYNNSTEANCKLGVQIDSVKTE